MYVGEKSFTFMSTFVNGYAAGRSYGNTLDLNHYLYLFGIWLATREKMPRNITWAGTVFAMCNEDDERALSRTPELFAEYIAECGSYSKQDWFNRYGQMIGSWKGERWSPLAYAPSPEKPPS